MAARLAAIDAQNFWMSPKIFNDQFLLYAFDGAPAVEPAIAEIRRRALVCQDLRLRVLDDCPARYPRWVFGAVSPSQFVVHDGRDWASCVAAARTLADDQLDAAAAAWRLHVFSPVTGVPGSSAAATVVVLQISHALADGTRAAALAGWLFGRPAPVAPVVVPRPGSLLLRSVAAARAHRHLVRDIDAGVLAAPPTPRPPLLTNSAPQGRRRAQVLLRRGEELGGPTVTVAVLAAIGTALAGYLRERGQDTSRLGAEVPLADTGKRHARNHFGNIGVGLYPDEPDRAALIAADLAAGRARAEHPAAVAARRAFAAMPAPLLRWGVGKFDAAARSPVVTGHTVVSSVNRGGADLRFGPARVLFTTDIPALSPMMSLVHGVHGIGDTIAVSVHAADSAGDVDDYLARLDRALG